jgi:hypothetical protein
MAKVGTRRTDEGAKSINPKKRVVVSCPVQRDTRIYFKTKFRDFGAHSPADLMSKILEDWVANATLSELSK